MARYPAMVRKRIIELYEQDYSTSEIAEVFGVCESGVRRVRQRLRERGTLDPLPRTCGRRPMMTAQVQRQIREQIAAHPDATRQEIRSTLGLSVSLQSISKWFKRLGLPLKKVAARRGAGPARCRRATRGLARRTEGCRSRQAGV